MSTIEKQLCDIVNELQCDFEQDNNDDITIFNHPDKDAIIDILMNLRKIVFLGYFRNRTIKVRTRRNNLFMLIEDVFFKLVKQIKIVLNSENDDDEVLTEKALKIT